MTALAGLLFIINPETHFFPTVTPVIAWLLDPQPDPRLCQPRFIGLGADLDGHCPREWTSSSRVLLVAGLSISTIVVSLFGPTPELIASFAWVLAASFVVNGAAAARSRQLRKRARSALRAGIRPVPGA